MFNVFMLIACVVGKGKYDALQSDLDRTKAEMTAAIAERDATVAARDATLVERDGRVRTLEEALRAEEERAAALVAERARLLKDTYSLKTSMADMEAALKELAERKAAADARIREFRSLLSRFQALIDAGKLKVKIVDGRMVVELATDVLFASGSAELSADGKTAITEVSRVLATIPDRQFQVEGHTDDVPIRTAQYPSNWELAAARSLTVVKTMVEAGLSARRVSAASFGSERPVDPGVTPTSRAANRRIEIVVVPDLSALPGFDELNKAAKE